MGTSPDCAVLGCGTGASGDGGRRQRDGSIFSRSDENVFSHRARDARWREKPRRFWRGFERVLARRVAVGETADQRISVRGAMGGAVRAMRAVLRDGELRGPLWPGRRGFQRFSRGRSPLKGTAFRLAWRAGYSHPGWSATSRRYSHSPFGCTAFRQVFRPRAVVLTVRMHRVWSRRWRHISTSRSLDSSGCVRCSPFGFTDIRVS
ncbi:hypothetical protein C6Q28_18105 [Burkholderia multivorans]|nr:hypothetical protein C6Q28_18105 [Burkholderia multivorans]